MIVGGIARLIVTFILVGNPKINIVGAAVSTLFCYVIISALDVFTIRRVLRHPPRLLSNLIKPAAASLLMGGAVLAVRFGLEKLGLRNLFVVAGSMLVAVIVYAVLVLVLKIIPMEDCRLLPKGDKIAKLLRIR
jgi:stage V sporulation protein B